MKELGLLFASSFCIIISIEKYTRISGNPFHSKTYKQVIVDENRKYLFHGSIFLAIGVILFLTLIKLTHN